MSFAGRRRARVAGSVAQPPGSDWGAGGIVQPNAAFFSDDFSSGDLTKSENGAEWIATRSCSVISCDGIGLVRPPTGRAHAVQFRYPGPAEQFAQLDLAVDTVGAGYAELNIEYFLYHPDGTEGGEVGPAWVTSYGPLGQKVIRFFDTPTTGPRSWAFGCENYYPGPLVDFVPTTGTKHRALLQSGGPGFYNSVGQITPLGAGYDVPAGQWLKYRWHCKTNTIEATGWNEGGDGVLRLYVNDVLRLETTTGSLCPAGGRVRGIYLMGNNNAAFDNLETRAYLADIRVTAGGAA